MSERDLESFERWLAPLIEKLSPGERRQLARQIARENRISQRERIKAQRNPGFTRADRERIRDNLIDHLT